MSREPLHYFPLHPYIAVAHKVLWTREPCCLLQFALHVVQSHHVLLDGQDMVHQYSLVGWMVSILWQVCKSTSEKKMSRELGVIVVASGGQLSSSTANPPSGESSTTVMP